MFRVVLIVLVLTQDWCYHFVYHPSRCRKLELQRDVVHHGAVSDALYQRWVLWFTLGVFSLGV